MRVDRFALRKSAPQVNTMVASGYPASSGRLITENQPKSGAWNMAFDAALLDGVLARNEIILRTYRWSEPTLSLGHFQKQVPADLTDQLQAIPSSPIASPPVSPSPPPPLPKVRRLSGGGAILHHHEWTYSCIVPPGHPLARRGTVLYEVVHTALIEAFGRLGIAARQRGESSPENPFLCFLRGDPRDVVVSGHKVTGSAQRRRRGAVLQHGSVLLRASPLAPAIPGLLDLEPAQLPSDWFGREEFIAVLSRHLFTDRPDRAPHPDDLSRTEEILKSKATPAIAGDE